MKSKKLALSSLVVLSGLLFSACASESQKEFNSSLIEYSGKKLTKSDVYQLAIDHNLVQTQVHDVVIADVFNQLYGNKVTTKDIEDQYNQQKALYASEDEFVKALKSVGLTPDNYKEQLKATIAYQKGLTDLLKINDNELIELYKSYTPEMTIKLALFDKEEDAQNFVNSVKNGSDFKLKADELNSFAATDNKAQVTLDSHSDELPEEILTSIYELNKDEISNVLPYKNENLDLTMYFVAQIVDKPKKSDNWKDYKSRLEEIYKKQKLTDQSFVDVLEKKALEKSNFKIKDKAFNEVFQSELNAK